MPANTFHFKGLLTKKGWLHNVTVTTNNDGNITAIDPETAIAAKGYSLPGFQNAHSHAFQYAMGGLAEYHEGSGIPDDFWSWRNAMYNLALTLSPDHLEAIATQLYVQMAKHGYTAVAEFHYLHHDTNGTAFANKAEMAERLIKAAQTAGIAITLVPMFYQKGGFGKEAQEGQRRFISKDFDAYMDLFTATQQVANRYTHAQMGIGIHSLRAVDKANFNAFMQAYTNEIPFHIHISEQLKEVEECKAFYGKRPVEWLLENSEATENFHLVHATHLNTAEVSGIAQQKAHVVLCPSTEGNLGDGFFELEAFQQQGGKWSIGTDSHVGLNPLEELRILDYGQRLRTHKRTSFFMPNQPDSGFNAMDMAYTAGQKAMGNTVNDFFEIGKPLNALVIDNNEPLLATASSKNLCNTMVYTQTNQSFLGTISQGEWVVKEGKHIQEQKTTEDFMATMQHLQSR